MFARLRKWLGRPERRVEVQIIKRDPLRVTTKEWRADGNLVQQGARALNDPTVRSMLDCLQATNFGKVALLDNSPNARSIHLARIEGFNMALNDFESLGRYEKPKEELEATFEDPEVLTTDEHR